MTLPAKGAPRRRPSKGGIGLLVLFAGLSAVAAGAHEVAWARMLGRVVGNTSYGMGITLAVWMAGNGVGAWLVSRARFLREARHAYAALELAIAVGTAAVFVVTALGAPPSSAVGLTGHGAFVFDVVTIGCLTSIPALGMGATFPVLVRSASPEWTSSVSVLYAVGLVGALVGIFGGAWVVAPAVGLDRLALAACALNASIALAAMARLPAPLPVAAKAEARVMDRRIALRFAAASFVGLGAQVVWNRTLLPYAGVSTYAFAAIITVYLLAQTGGFAIAARLGKRLETAGFVSLAASGPAVLGGLALLGAGAPQAARDANPAAWVGQSLLSITIVVALPAVLLGVSQAAVLATARADQTSTADVGLVVGAGSIAGAVGALGTSLLFLPSFGPRFAIAALTIAPALALLGEKKLPLALLTVSSVACLAVLAPGPAYFLGPSFDRATTLFVETGVQDTTAVVEVDLPAEPRIRRLVANGVSYSGDSIFAQRYMRLLAHLPASSAQRLENGLVICIGTGTTLDALRKYPFAHIDAVDISPSIHRTIDQFDHVNHGAARDPHVRVTIEDGTRFLQLGSRRYDVITLEPPPPRAPGASSLYSKEFYELARSRLSPGGAIAQWLPLHGMSSDEARAIVRTFVDVFPDASLHVAERNEAVLLGSRGSPATRETRTERSRYDVVARDLASIALEDLEPVEDTLVAEDEALAALGADGAVIRDLWPMPEFAPFAGASSGHSPLDAWLGEVARQAPDTTTSGAILGAALASFNRIEEGRSRPSDRAAVKSAMFRLLARHPSDPYWQHAFGFGPLLEARLERLRLSRDDAARLRQAMNARRARTMEELERL